MLSRFAPVLRRRHGALLVFAGVFIAVSAATRIALLVKSASAVTWDASIAAAFGWGLLFDAAAAAWFTLPLALVLAVLPARFFQHRLGRAAGGLAAFALLALLGFGAIAEWLFWDEFSTRFNFIAVDYLVYTKEVAGNINESYPMPRILAGLALASAAAWWFLRRLRWPVAWMDAPPASVRARWATAAICIIAATTLGLAVDSDWLPSFKNNYNRELARNGVWSLVAAFRNNELEYDQFYRTMPVDQAFARLREELTEDGSILLRPTERDTLRYVANDGPELRLNVVQITVESLSADFVSSFNRASKLTPNLTALAERSLVFTNLYATGTRTDRGMEALTLSIPPTPGRSLVKRPHNGNLFSLGSVFRAKGYDTAFIYGGYGYFDNMNVFFGGNGYRVIDRNSPFSDVTFANIWGACDEDLFRWTLREADTQAAAGTPFHFFVMTTSNHRPYTFPDGRIDLPSKISGRAGAVKYSDFAIGQFLRDAATRPWFNNTVFVIVADHCASVAGKNEIPVSNYHIPMFIFAPGGQIAPGVIDTLTSQMDYAPTLLGLLGWSYPSRFFGHDVRKTDPAETHALIGNYQKLGHLEAGELVILQPRQGVTTYHFDRPTLTLTETPDTGYGTAEAVSFYQTASQLYHSGTYRALSAEEFQTYSALGRAEVAAKRAAALALDQR